MSGLKCPTCGSDRVPEIVERAIGAISSTTRGQSDGAVITQLLQHLYIHGTSRAAERSGLEKGMHKVLESLSPQTAAAVEELGVDAVYAFFKSRFGEPEA